VIKHIKAFIGIIVEMSSVEDFCEQLFSKEPEPSGTVDLSIDVGEPSEYFEVLLLIMTNGLKKWYGDRIDIANVSLKHIERLKEYFLSFGINIRIDNEEKPDIYIIDNKSYLHKTKLDDMSFTVEGPTTLYTVKFSFIL
jgi:hypothetical protein